MKLRNVSIFAVAAMVALTACGGDDDAEDGVVADSAVVVDTSMAAPMDTAGMATDTGAMGGDTTGGDTTKAP